MNGVEGTHGVTWRSPLIRIKVLLTALLMAFFCYGFFTWILWPVKVLGQSMMPNYPDGSRHFINKLAYISAQPQRGDVVGLHMPNDEIYMKRIVGLPGENVQLQDGEISINDEFLAESYIRSKVPPDLRLSVTLLPDQYFVIGDNRATSIFRPIPRSDIIGKVVY